MKRYQLPPELRMLENVTAQPFLQLDEDFKRPNLEGAEFNRDGKLVICRRLHPGSEVLVIDVDTKEVRSIYHESDSNLIGVAIHKDGRMFLVDIKGRLPVISPEGEFLFDMMDAPGLKRFIPNDLAFDANGNIYVSDFNGKSEFAKPDGGIVRFSAQSDYKEFRYILTDLTTPNGVGFGIGYKSLWTCESGTNDLIRVNIDPDGMPLQRFTAIKRVIHTSGFDLMDSLKTDDLGNVYVAMMDGGRLLVVDQDGIAVENVLQSDREEGRCLHSPNLAIHPSRPEGYILASGKGGSWLYKFEALAPASHMYAFKD